MGISEMIEKQKFNARQRELKRLQKQRFSVERSAAHQAKVRSELIAIEKSQKSIAASKQLKGKVAPGIGKQIAKTGSQIGQGFMKLSNMADDYLDSMERPPKRRSSKKHKNKKRRSSMGNMFDFGL